jgi:hypothetical protein
MLKVCFTGPGYTADGQAVVRSALSQACINAGVAMIRPKVEVDTDILVASRTDTVKAKNAALIGVTVMTYPEFISQFLADVALETNGVANKWVDDLDAMVPDFTTSQTLAEIDQL